uniref:DUF6291 domain-containing protein n=1 Tax=viral metagenome TaxID=1070528 RepID=A0A6M3IY07_9ZZZZ
MKESFLIYKSFYDPIKGLSNEQLGRLFRALFDYQLHNTKCTDNDILMAFSFFINQFRVDDNKYKKIVEKRREIGKKGGLAKASKSKQKLALLSKPAYNVNENVNVNENENVNVKKEIYKEKKLSFAEFVLMTKTEHDALIAKYGKSQTEQMIEMLDNYKGSSGKKYKSDYRAILSWVVAKAAQAPKDKLNKSIAAVDKWLASTQKGVIDVE